MAGIPTTADRVARRAVYGYATDVISAAVYTYMILPNRWRVLIRDARAQRQLEQQTWEALAGARHCSARGIVARGIQCAFRNQQAQKTSMKEQRSQEVISRLIWRWVVKQRVCREAATRRLVIEDWLQRTLMCSYMTRRDHAQRVQRAWRRYLVKLKMDQHRSASLIQRQWCAHHTRQHRVMEFERHHEKLAQVKVNFSRERIRCWARMILFRRAHVREQEQEQKNKDERDYEAREQETSNQAACRIQTRWRQHHQRILRRQVMTVESAHLSNDVEGYGCKVNTIESDSILHQELLQHSMRQRLERFLLVCVKKSSKYHSAHVQHQSNEAQRVINRCLRQYLQRRRDSLARGPESDELNKNHVDVDRGLVDDAVVQINTRMVGLSGRIPMRPPKPTEWSFSSESPAHPWKPTNAVTTSATASHHRPVRSSPQLRDDMRSIKRSGLTSSSSWTARVTSQPTVLPPLRVAQHTAKPHTAHRQQRLTRTEFDAGGNQSDHCSNQDDRHLPPLQSEKDVDAPRTLPPLQRATSVAGTTRLVKRSEPERSQLPRIPVRPTNQAATYR